ncbi:MAG TPA: GPP34 family phosphoprotein [Roseococcus sp.]|jgi:hypothetical protein|nr:GPP34 family phosphoprotein [Roseococcus sp.]
MDALLGPAGLSTAEALEILRLSLPPVPRDVVWWSDLDYPLAAAQLMDLSLRGEVDTDLHSVTRMGRGSLPPFLTPLLDGPAPIEPVIEAILGRIGDVRAEILAALQTRGYLEAGRAPLPWGFCQARPQLRDLRAPAALRATIRALVEGDDLPSPEQAALVSVLHASGRMADILALPAPETWQARHAARIEAIGRMELLGRGVSATLARLRERLRAYVLWPEGRPRAAPRPGARWEWRAFWPAGARPFLPTALDLAGAARPGDEETEADTYLFVHGKRDNIKLRGGGLKVKPVIEAFDEFCAFGPSLRLAFPARAQRLSGIFARFNDVHAKLRDREQLLAALVAAGYRPGVVEVRKTRRQYRAILGVKAELARITVGDREFLSLSLESRYLTALRVLSRHVEADGAVVAGYAEFLERVAPGRG